MIKFRLFFHRSHRPHPPPPQQQQRQRQQAKRVNNNNNNSNKHLPLFLHRPSLWLRRVIPMESIESFNKSRRNTIVNVDRPTMNLANTFKRSSVLAKNFILTINVIRTRHPQPPLPPHLHSLHRSRRLHTTVTVVLSRRFHIVFFFFVHLLRHPIVWNNRLRTTLL